MTAPAVQAADSVTVPAVAPVVLVVMVTPDVLGLWSMMNLLDALTFMLDKTTVGVEHRTLENASSGNVDPLVTSTPPRTTMGTDMVSCFECEPN
jgi:hypothetical protein